MKNSLIYLGFCLASFQVAAQVRPLSLPWLEPMLVEEATDWNATELNQMEGLYDCGETEEEEYCSEPVSYYNVRVDSNVWLKEERITKVEVSARFTPFNYSELQLNLRKDGFVLAKVRIGSEQLDVIEELKSKPLMQVDREVVMFMNKGPITSPRVLVWYPKDQYLDERPSRYAEFKSNGKTVSAIFVRNHY